MRHVSGWKFRRQHPIGPYFVDFYCPAARLVVEIVPSTPEASPLLADDQSRADVLAADGYRVVEVRAADVEADLDGVIDAIDRELRAVGSSASRHARRGEVQARPWASRSGQPYERQGYGRRE